MNILDFILSFCKKPKLDNVLVFHNKDLDLDIRVHGVKFPSHADVIAFASDKDLSEESVVDFEIYNSEENYRLDVVNNGTIKYMPRHKAKDFRYNYIYVGVEHLYGYVIYKFDNDQVADLDLVKTKYVDFEKKLPTAMGCD